MKQSTLHSVRGMFAILFSFVLLSLAIPAYAQNSAQPATQPAAPQQQQTTQRSTTTTTQTERAVQNVDPLWFVLGGIALLAIILIVVLASRGRGRDHTHVHESTTVVKKE